VSEGGAQLDWTEELRPGRGPALVASAAGTKFGFVSDRGEAYTPPPGGKRCRWQVWATGAGADVDTLEEGRAAVEAEWARVNEEQPA